VTGILAMSYAAKMTIGLAFTFFVLMPLLAHGLLGFAGVVARGEKDANEDYVENVSANE
jgi:hypothetical protein